MRTMDVLKLTQLSKAEMEARQMNALRGGDLTCNCVCPGCACSGSDPSSADNAQDSTDAGQANDVADNNGSDTKWINYC